jgi:transposase
MSKRRKKKSEVKKITQFEIINYNVAGVDVSDTEMVVAFPVNEHEVCIHSYGTFTRDLRCLSDTLKKSNITSVAMESTGVYWIPLFLLLQEEGIEVCLVNAKHVKNVTGRKTDEGDAEWIQKLHRCGLLSASFQPDNWTRTLRSYVRHRDGLVKTCTTYLNRIQKALEMMNIKLHTVISDIDGKTGQNIISSIIAGERDAEVLADLRDRRIKASREEIILSLEGTWTEEHLFELEQCFRIFKYHRGMIEECEKKIESHLIEQIKAQNGGIMPSLEKKKRKTNYKKGIKADMTTLLDNVNGVNVTEITGISELSALSILAETGTDMSHWKSEKHFTSWLGLAPNTKISGGNIISSKVPKKKHYAGQAFRISALSMSKSMTPLGEYYRRIRSRAGGKKAVIATARKIAIIYYHMLSKKTSFDPLALLEYQNKYKEKKIRDLEKYLEKLKKAG